MIAALRALVLLVTASLGAATSWAQDAAFAVGQVWGVKDRPTVEVVIGRIEMAGPMQVVHVSITGVPIPGPDPETPQLIAINHMPFSEQAIRLSIDRLIRTDGQPTPGFEDGYGTWKAANGGVFTIALRDAVDLAIDQYRKAAAQPQ